MIARDAITKAIGHIAFTAAALVAISGCQQFPSIGGESKPAPAAPQITEESLRERATQQLATGVKQYDAGDYENAVKSLSASLEHGMLSKADQSRARKYLAFSHCVSGREQQCRDEFRKAFEINPEFALTPAEDGHPVWGPIYRDVRTQLIAEREAAQTRRTSSFIPLGKAEQMLADGLVKYDSGEYKAAGGLLERAIKEGLKEKSDKVRAMKYLSFTLCLEAKYRDCRAEFIKIYEVDPNFDLTPAEAGHPSWTHTFASAKAEAKKLQREKELKEAKEKSKGAPAPASVPKK